MNTVKALLNTLVREGIFEIYIAVAIGLAVLSVSTQASQAMSSPGVSLEQSFALVSQAILKNGFLLGTFFSLLIQGYLLSVPMRTGILSLRLTGSSSRTRYVFCTLLVAGLLLTTYLTGIVLTAGFQLKAWRIAEERFFSCMFAFLTRLGMFLALFTLLGIAFEISTSLPGMVGSLLWLLVSFELRAPSENKSASAFHVLLFLPRAVLSTRTPVSGLEWLLFASALLCLTVLSVFAAERRNLR